MHLYVLTRGILDAVRNWREALNNVYLPMDCKNKKTGKPEKRMVQLMVRPVELYEIVFPAEHEKAVMELIKPGTDFKAYGGKWTILFKYLRKKLGLKPPIDRKKWKPRLLPYLPGVSTMALGTKADEFNYKITKKKDPNSAFDEVIPKELL